MKRIIFVILFISFANCFAEGLEISLGLADDAVADFSGVVDVKVDLGGFSNLSVVDLDSNQEYPLFQVSEQCEDLVFIYVDLKRGESRRFLFADRSMTKVSYYFCRSLYIFPQRSDLAWENNLAAYRVYGPLLKKSAERSGVDCWTKRISSNVVERWYSLEFSGEQSYHEDNSEGFDQYSVGSGPGCGGVVFSSSSKKFYNSNTFAEYEILESGPVRTRFRLEYEGFLASGVKITESRIVSLDYNSFLSHFVVDVDLSRPSSKLNFSPGLAFFKKENSIVYGEDFALCSGRLFDYKAFSAIALLSGSSKFSPEETNNLGSFLSAFAPLSQSSRLEYLAGLGWEESPVAVNSIESWESIVSGEICSRKLLPSIKIIIQRGE